MNNVKPVADFSNRKIRLNEKAWLQPTHIDTAFIGKWQFHGKERASPILLKFKFWSEIVRTGYKSFTKVLDFEGSLL